LIRGQKHSSTYGDEQISGLPRTVRSPPPTDWSPVDPLGPAGLRESHSPKSHAVAQLRSALLADHSRLTRRLSLYSGDLATEPELLVGGRDDRGVEGDPGIPLEVGSLGRARSYGNEQTSVAEYGSDGVDSGNPVPRHRGQEDIRSEEHTSELQSREN